MSKFTRRKIRSRSIDHTTSIVHQSCRNQVLNRQCPYENRVSEKCISFAIRVKRKNEDTETRDNRLMSVADLLK